MNYNYLQAIGGTLSILSLLLGTKQSYFMWPIKVISTCISILVYYHYSLYAKTVFSILSIVMMVYGMYKWFIVSAVDNNGSKVKNTISKLANLTRVKLLSIGLLVTIVWGRLLDIYTNADVTYFDALYATFGLMAKWLMANKKIESWLILVTIDLVYINVCLYKGLHVFAVKYCIYVIIGIYGYHKWKKNLVVLK